MSQPPEGRDDARRQTERLLQANLSLLAGWLRRRMPRQLQERESCSDVLQSVCREVLASERAFAGTPEAFRAWLLAYAQNKVRDRLRYWQAGKRDARVEAPWTASGAQPLPGPTPTPSVDAAGRESGELFERALARLSPEHREVIGLCALAGGSSEEVGRMMGGRSPGAVRSLLNRARAALTTELERLGFAP